MAHVEKRTQGDRARWRVRWRGPDGKERSKTFDRAAQARQYAAEVEISLSTHRYVDPRAGKATVRDYGERWRAAQVVRPGTAEVIRRALGRLYDTVGHRPIGAVRRTEVQGWVRHLEATLAPSTIEVTYNYAAAMFRAAVDDRVIGESPCKKITLPQRDTSKVVPLTDAAVAALIGHAGSDWPVVFTIMAGTGLRPGEALGLSWGHVDWLRRVVVVDRQALTPAKGSTELGPLKTAASERVVPLPGSVLAVLAGHAPEDPDPAALVFPSPVFPARPRRRGAIVQAFGRARVAAFDVARAEARARGDRRPVLPPVPEGATPHDLRHYYASLLIHEGEPVTVVQRRLGHKSAVETLTTYAHLWPDVEDSTRAAVDRHLGAGAARSRPEVGGAGA